MKIKTLLLFVISFPKTLWFNFKYFPFYDAIKLPVFVSQRVWLMTMDGKRTIKNYRGAALISSRVHNALLRGSVKTSPSHLAIWAG